jgi:hypothetical protein
VYVTGNANATPVNTQGTSCNATYVQCFDAIGNGPLLDCANDSQRNNNGIRPNKRSSERDVSSKSYTKDDVYIFWGVASRDPPDSSAFNSDTLNAIYSAIFVSAEEKAELIEKRRHLEGQKRMEEKRLEERKSMEEKRQQLSRNKTFKVLNRLLVPHLSSRPSYYRDSSKRNKSVKVSSRSTTYNAANINITSHPLLVPNSMTNPADLNSATSPSQVVTVYNSFAGGQFIVSNNISVLSANNTPPNFIRFLTGNLPQCSNGMTGGQPVVLFDTSLNTTSGSGTKGLNGTGRWVVAEVGTLPYIYCVYISATSDAHGSWYGYQFNLSTPRGSYNAGDPGSSGIPVIVYPKLGAWPRLYALSMVNMTCVLDKVAMWRNNATAGLLCINAKGSLSSSYVWTPINVESITIPWQTEIFYYANNNRLPGVVFVSLSDTEYGSNVPPNTGKLDFVNVQHWYTVNFTGVPFVLRTTSYQVPVVGFDVSPDPITGPNGANITPVTGAIMNRASYRYFPKTLYESVVGTFTDRVRNPTTRQITATRTRWFELRFYKLDANSQPQFYLYQDASVSYADGLAQIIPSIEMDSTGNIAIAFVALNSTTYPSLYGTMQLQNDPLNSTRIKTLLFAPLPSPSLSSGPWGAYGSISALARNQYYVSSSVADNSGSWIGVTMLIGANTEIYNRTFRGSFYKCLQINTSCSQTITAIG